jgi:hypothetical protein
VFCITTGRAATQAGSLQSAPSVQININKATAASSGISFGSAFLLMVTEI